MTRVSYWLRALHLRHGETVSIFSIGDEPVYSLQLTYYHSFPPNVRKNVEAVSFVSFHHSLFRTAKSCNRRKADRMSERSHKTQSLHTDDRLL
jgi:hypothetical protein